MNDRMTETRKELISVLSECMDKELSEGCYFYGFSNNSHKRFIHRMINNNTEYVTSEDLDSHITNNIEPYWEVDENGVSDDGIIVEKILGHYDITAVLKYIENKLVGTQIIDITMESIKVLDEPRDMTREEVCDVSLSNPLGLKEVGYKQRLRIFSIPNKPLHLFSHEEEKYLLQLLQKIGN